jgi:hypothetical protein
MPFPLRENYCRLAEEYHTGERQSNRPDGPDIFFTSDDSFDGRFTLY